MKKNIIKVVSSIIFLFFTVNCTDDFDEINTNPDAPVNVTSQMLATELILNITRDEIGVRSAAAGNTKAFMLDYMRGKYISWSEQIQDDQYNKFSRGSFDAMVKLTSIEKMIGYANSEEEIKTYTALGDFIHSFVFYDLTMRYGDVPYTETLKGESEGIVHPKYDSQKTIFLGILNKLDEADKLFSEGVDFDGDPIYGGDVQKWRKLVNSFALKVLINLYKKTGDSDLDVVNRFKNIVNNRPIFESNDDNFQLVFSDNSGQKYPFYKEGNQYIIYPMVSSTLIDTLKSYGDYRLFYYAAPSPVKIEEGMSESDFDAYVGTEPSLLFSDIEDIYASRDYSDINDRYKEIPEGEPIAILSYAQVKFILAEAAIRGWISSSAESHYEEGIKAALKFVADNTPDDAAFHHNMVIDDDYIQDYLTSEKVKFASTFDEQLAQIITQKYISTYLQSLDNAFFENRRTGYAEFMINTSSNLNQPSDKLPVRWLYPQDELDYNGENYQEAVDRQFNGVDDTNQIMWILKD